MRCATILGCLLLLAARAAADGVDELSATLTSGSWSKDLGDPKMPERYVYTFAKDGTYKSVLFTDFTPSPTTTGRWQLVKGTDDKLHLQLKNKEGKYPWLAEDSVIRYDPKKDLLLVSGLRYAGEVPLRHEEEKSKTEPRGVPLEARLIARKDTYVLTLGGKTPEEFRQLLKDSYPPAPTLDLELVFRNRGSQALTFLVGGTNPDVPLLLKLSGPGAVNVTLPPLLAGIVSIPPKQVTLAPGKTHTLPIKSLMTSRLGREGTASYWTGPGDYTLTAIYKSAVSPVPEGTKDNGQGFGPVTVLSAPVKLKVVHEKGGE